MRVLSQARYTGLVVVELLSSLDVQYLTIDKIRRIILISFSDAIVSSFGRSRQVSTYLLVDTGEDIEVRRKQTRDAHDEQDHLMLTIMKPLTPFLVTQPLVGNVSAGGAESAHGQLKRPVH